VVVAVPKRLAEEVERRGVDVGPLVVDLLVKLLGLDPQAAAESHLELASKYLEEGRSLVDKDPVQASEKLYKAAEEAVKAVAAALDVEEHRKAADQGRWTAALLFDAVDSISAKLGVGELPLWWRAAWVLHVEGFHEARLGAERVRRDFRYVEAMVGLARKALRRGGGGWKGALKLRTWQPRTWGRNILGRQAP
jgi:hypothetical protein